MKVADKANISLLKTNIPLNSKAAFEVVLRPSYSELVLYLYISVFSLLYFKIRNRGMKIGKVNKITVKQIVIYPLNLSENVLNLS